MLMKYPCCSFMSIGRRYTIKNRSTIWSRNFTSGHMFIVALFTIAQYPRYGKTSVVYRNNIKKILCIYTYTHFLPIIYTYTYNTYMFILCIYWNVVQSWERTSCHLWQYWCRKRWMLYDTTYMWTVKKPNSLKQRAQWWLPGAGRLGG